MKNIAIVMHMGANGLGITRSLGRSGVHVYGIDYDPTAAGFLSKFCRKKIIFPYPVTDEKKCLDELLKIGKNEDNAVLIPASDLFVELISKYADRLSEHFLFNIPDSSIVDTLINKSKQYKFAKNIGIPIPISFSPASIEDLSRNAASLTYPVIIKGTKSHEWTSAFNCKAILVNNYEELMGYYVLTSSKNINIVVQEMIVGPNSGHYKVCAYYSQSKELLGVFSTQKIRQFPTNFGVGCYMKSYINPDLIRLGRKFFEGLGYTGMGSIEFKRDQRDGRFKLIELNSRFWLQNIQAYSAGVNFPYINYLDCIGVKTIPCLTFSNNIYWLDLIQDFRSFLEKRKRGEESMATWIKSLRHANCFAYYSSDDLLPILRYSKNILKKLLNKKFKKGRVNYAALN
jgi:predicted ATP-grasp superfamily ATP-dependent carboligase